MSASVAVVGLGRIGLPLALSFADHGCEVIGIDREPSVLDRIRTGQMPFKETGTQELLERVMDGDRLDLSQQIQDASGADYIILTLGTPALAQIEIDVSQIRQAVDDLMPVLREGQTIILRSTVGPGTTEWLAGYLEQLRGFRIGEDLFVAHVPERIAVNHFLEEIETLPTIVGGVGEESSRRAAALFDVFGAQIEQTTPVQAELAKIWTNILRYANFALPNLLMMQCARHGANVSEVIDLINRDYPRGGMAMPGLTARTCPTSRTRSRRPCRAPRRSSSPRTTRPTRASCPSFRHTRCCATRGTSPAPGRYSPSLTSWSRPLDEPRPRDGRGRHDRPGARAAARPRP